MCKDQITTNKKDFIWRELLPTLGLFGDESWNRLVLHPELLIDSIEIGVHAPYEEILNFNRLQIFDSADSLVSLWENVSKVEFSSTYSFESFEDARAAFLSSGYTHSATEARPRVRFYFRYPCHINKIIITSRADEYASRCMFLYVNCFLKDRKIFAFTNRSEREFGYHLGLIRSVLGVEKAELLEIEVRSAAKALGTAAYPDALHRAYAMLLEVIAVRLETCDLSPSDIWRLLSVLPAGSSDKLHQICSNLQQQVLAAAVSHLLAKLEVINTSVIGRSSYLFQKKDELFSFSKMLTVALTKRKFQTSSVVISKHQIKESIWQRHGDEFLDCLSEVFHVLTSHNCVAFLAYGSLLGARRNGDFIEHDDDVDLVYIDTGSNYDEVLQNRNRISDILIHSGFNVGPDKEHFHLQIYKGNVAIDVFPSWIAGDQLMLLMENMKLRGSPLKFYLPLSAINLRTVSLPAPGDIDAALGDRYGPNWKISDPFYEWPWEMST